jgi:hypothetical protein
MTKPKVAEGLPGRPASSPIKGSMRDMVRTFVAFFVAFLFVKLGGALPGVELAGVQEAVIVILTSALMAFIGKAFRNSGMAIGKIL